MVEIILSALLLTLIQSWLLPMLLNLGNLSFLLSNRDEDFEFSTITKRAKRASANLYETLPVFITLMLLGIIFDVDLILSTRTCLEHFAPKMKPGGVIFSQDGHLRATIDLLEA